MSGRRNRARAAAILASAAAHLGVLTVLALQAPVLPRQREDAGPPEPIIPILIMPRSPRADAGAPKPTAVRIHRRSFRTRMLEPPTLAPAPLVVAPAAAAPEANAAPSAPTPPLPSVGLPTGVQAALRGRLGCEERAGVRLTASERAACTERLGRGIATAPLIPVGTELTAEKKAALDRTAAARDKNRRMLEAPLGAFPNPGKTDQPSYTPDPLSPK